MHFLPFVSVILATAVLVTSEPSAQFDSFEIAALDGTTLFTDKSYDLIPRSYQHLKLTIRLGLMEIMQAIFLHRRQGMVYPGNLRHNKSHQGS